MVKQTVKHCTMISERIQHFIVQEKSNMALSPKFVHLENDGDIIAVACLHDNPLHPQNINLSFCIKDNQHRIFKKLIDLVKRSHFIPKDKIGLKIMLDSPHPWSDALEESGFECILSGYIAQISMIDHKPLLPDNLTLIRYDDLTEQQRISVNNFRIAGYIKTHHWNPPVDGSSTLCEKTELNDSDKALSFAVFKGNEIILTSELHDEEEEKWFGWVHFVRTHPDITDTLKYVLSQQILANKTSMWVECDDSDPFAIARSDSLTLSQQSYYHHYQLVF